MRVRLWVVNLFVVATLLMSDVSMGVTSPGWLRGAASLYAIKPALSRRLKH
jgi:hypothetical protein